MALKVLKDERKVKLNKKGNYEFEHVLIQELGQSNVNSLIESTEQTKKNSEEFINNYDNIINELKEQTKKNLDGKKNEFVEFLNKITEENKTELALEYFNELIESKKKFIESYDDVLEKAYKDLESYVTPQKDYSIKIIDDAEKTLKFWKKYHKKEE